MKLSEDCPIDLPKLLETRLLVQANSGGGKSYLLRRLLEQTAAKVQQIVIDPEGEFSTLRERFDYVICAPQGGDAVAHPSTAGLLARRLLETGVSAILNIYDLKAHQRQAFVRLFCEELVNAPKTLWHPVLVVLDEAHVYAPEQGKAESTAAVIDLATRGRKRGYCLCMATQRLSKLHKDAAAEMINKLIGRTGLDIDVKRAAEELGLVGREAAGELRRLQAGDFYAYGPALSQEVRRIRIGTVHTTHPRSGHRLLAGPPEPSAKIRAILAKGLQDIPKEAETEARTLTELKAEVASLRAHLTRAEKAAAGAGVPEPEVHRRIAQAVQEALRSRPAAGAQASAGAPSPRVRIYLEKALAMLASPHARPIAVKVPPAPSRAQAGSRRGKLLSEGAGLRSGAARILRELCARMPAGYSRAQVATLTGFSPKGGTFNTYLSDLRSGSYIEERQGLVFATREGLGALGGEIPKAPTSHADVMAIWQGALRAGAFKMLQVIVDNPRGIDRDSLAAQVGMERSGGTFNTYLSDLRRNGLIEENDGISIPASILQLA